MVNLKRFDDGYDDKVNKYLIWKFKFLGYR